MPRKKTFGAKVAKCRYKGAFVKRDAQVCEVHLCLCLSISSSISLSLFLFMFDFICAKHDTTTEQSVSVCIGIDRHNQLYWYRHRSRAIIIGYRYFVATGFLLPETRGKCKGTSLIHDPTVRHLCFEVITQLGPTWSARTFRDRISVKLYESGYLKPGTKIGRTTATYYLRTIGMVLVHPKKGIY